AAGGAVDRAEAILVAVARGLLHARAGEADDAQRLLVGHGAQRPPRIDPGGEAALGLPQVADAGDRALVEQPIADGARLIRGAQARQEAALVELGGEDVWPQASDPLIEARP